MTSGPHLGERYRVLPASIPLRVPGFDRDCPPDARTFSVVDRDCAAWFDEFVDRVVAARGKRFLPVCRMSDGEFLFALGPQPANPGASLKARIASRLHMAREAISPRPFYAGARGRYDSGQYTRAEWRSGRRRFAEGIRFVASTGVLAMHLSYGSVPFQERYFPGLVRWLREERVSLHAGNYVPFYFVYAALTGPRRGELLRGRVLVLNGADGEKRDRIVAGLRREGVAEILWHPLSASRSLFDAVDVRPYVGKVDLVLVGAGVGKPNVMLQLEPLGVPCIDAGYVFEVWADPRTARFRPFCDPNVPSGATP